MDPDWLLKISNQSEAGPVSKMDHTIWKRIKNWADKWSDCLCYFVCLISVYDKKWLVWRECLVRDFLSPHAHTPVACSVAAEHILLIWRASLLSAPLDHSAKLPHNSSYGTEQGLLRLLRTQPHRKYQSLVHNSLLRTHQFILVPKLPLIAKLQFYGQQAPK